MKTFRRIIVLFAVTTMVTGLLSACGKKDKNEKEGRSRNVAEEKLPDLPGGNSVNVKTFYHGTMPIEIDVPEEALITETEDSITAETTRYLFYVFGFDSYKGALLNDAMDVLGLVNADEADETSRNEAEDILRLRSFTLSQKENGKIYTDLGGVDGFWCPMSSMEFDSQSGRKSSGEGFLMVYEKNKGYGLYVVLGIMKGGQVNADIKTMLQNCAMSLKQDSEGMGEFEEWNGSLPDGTDIKAIFKKGTVLNTDEDTNGICLHYDESDTGFFLIQHYNTIGKGSSEEYMKNLLETLKKDEGVSCSEVENVEGSMYYSRGTITYDSEDGKMCEVIHACVSNGEVWIVDLVGTVEQVEQQKKENLSLLLKSLKKD